MRKLVSELIVSLDGFARGHRSPGYFGFFGPDFAEWIKTNTAAPHETLIGRRTYVALEEVPPEARDEGYHTMRATTGWLFSRTLRKSDWPRLKLVRDDVVGLVRELKRSEGPELRTLGSLSLVRHLLEAGLVDRLKLVVAPLILPKSGMERIYEGLPDLAFTLISTRVLDDRILLLEYQPIGEPPYANDPS